MQPKENQIKMEEEKVEEEEKEERFHSGGRSVLVIIACLYFHSILNLGFESFP